ncbi:MAG: hypothetical protein J6A01_10970 [Proteobacteria bacterium]|nr:hypothetical protein [Pseudomonadota bacterium]
MRDVRVHKEHIPTKVQDELLRNVSSYGEPGNIDLWQALDDVLPRNKDNLPACYLNLEDRTSSHYSDGNPIFKETSFMVDEFKRHELLEVLLKFLISFGLLIIGIFLYFKFSGNLLEPFIVDGANLMQSGDLVLLGGSTIVCMILIVLSFFILYGTDKWLSFLSHRTHKQSLSIKELGCDADRKIIENLLQNGRKTIATICSIDYVECSNQFVEHHTIEDSPDDHSPNTIVRYAYHAGPLFKISYQFNPPDDEKKEDLIHYIYTSVAPEGHYQVGDPLPILYRIYRNEDNRESVDSMPFPIPLDDISGDRRVVYYRTREELAEDARKQEEERKRQQAEFERLLKQKKEKEREEELKRKASAREVKRQAYQNIKARETAKSKSYAQYSGKAANARAYQKGRRF